MEPKDYAVVFMDYMIASKHLIRDNEKPIPPHGEFGVLAYLYHRHDGANVGELTEFLHVTSGRTACALKSLERKELIVRQTDEKDNRRICVFLTEKGKKTVNEEYEKAVAAATQIFQKLGPEDSEEYIRLVKKIIE